MQPVSDESSGRALLDVRFPEIDAHRVIAIATGWDSFVLEVNDALIFRFPRRPQIEANLRKEIALLPILAPHLPARVPRFSFISDGPYPFVGYEKIEGTRLTSEFVSTTDRSQVASQLARFLGALHRFPVERASEAGVPGADTQQWRAKHHRFFRRVQEKVFPLLDVATRRRAEALFRQFLDDESNFCFPPALVHYDLGADHILCSQEGEIQGVIDWSDCEIGDPAVDFAWFLNTLGADFAESLLAAYWHRDNSIPGRARFYYHLAPWHDVLYGQETGQHSFVEHGLMGIKARLR